MNKIFKSFVLAALLLLSVGASARHVSPADARKVAETFLRRSGCKFSGSLVDRTAEMKFNNMYLFTADEGGFVLVSADDCAKPILGYSPTDRFATKDVPAPVAAWLAGYEEEIAHLSQCGGKAVSQWGTLLRGSMPKAVMDSAVGPLMTTRWNQSPYYNDLCPTDSANESGHTYAGCTAMATAQVMKYWNFPERGYGSHSYEHSDYGTLEADFGNTAYLWDDMPNVLNSSSSQAEVEAVATLVYHVGVAVEMDYGPERSGAALENKNLITSASAENALREFFKYKSDIYSVYQSDFEPNEYLQLLYNELNHRRPFLYAGDGETGGGHAFVMDGYDTTGAFHVNWGWGGYCDGFYAVGALNPSSYSFNRRDRAVIGIEPSHDFDTASVTTFTASLSNTDLGSVTGAGTYNFGDTVYLRVSANEGCRFVKWSDGCKYNPRPFVATGGSFDFSAVVEPLSGDTLSYCTTSSKLTSVGYSTPRDIYWGIRLPASTLTAGHHLRQVQLYINGVGNYSTIIYLGNTSHAVYEQSFTVTDDDKNTWKTVELDTPVPIDGTQDLWICFHTTDIKYPITFTFYNGNPDGKLSGTSFAPSSRERSHMIRGIFGADAAGIADAEEQELTLYPNPSKGMVHIEGAVVERVRVYDLQGREVASSEGGNDVDLGALGTGVYALHIVTARGAAVRMVVRKD